jgi:hypothetical protein
MSTSYPKAVATQDVPAVAPVVLSRAAGAFYVPADATAAPFPTGTARRRPGTGFSGRHHRSGRVDLERVKRLGAHGAHAAGW